MYGPPYPPPPFSLPPCDNPKQNKTKQNKQSQTTVVHSNKTLSQYIDRDPSHNDEEKQQIIPSKVPQQFPQTYASQLTLSEQYTLQNQNGHGRGGGGKGAPFIPVLPSIDPHAALQQKQTTALAKMQVKSLFLFFCPSLALANASSRGQCRLSPLLSLPLRLAHIPWSETTTPRPPLDTLPPKQHKHKQEAAAKTTEVLQKQTEHLASVAAQMSRTQQKLNIAQTEVSKSAKQVLNEKSAKQALNEPFAQVNDNLDLFWRCQICQNDNDESFQFCPRCGKPNNILVNSVLGKGNLLKNMGAINDNSKMKPMETRECGWVLKNES